MQVKRYNVHIPEHLAKQGGQWTSRPRWMTINKQKTFRANQSEKILKKRERELMRLEREKEQSRYKTSVQ